MVKQPLELVLTFSPKIPPTESNRERRLPAGVFLDFLNHSPVEAGASMLFTGVLFDAAPLV
jgi:hypothetical protein